MRKPTKISVLNFESFVKMSRRLYQFFACNSAGLEVFSQTVQDYLKCGEAMGLVEVEEKPDSRDSVYRVVEDSRR